jgi:hypothetical protein
VSIDLPPEHQGSLCLLCGDEGSHQVAHLLDRDLGPLCHDCFAEALKATTELRWAALVPLPPKTPTRKANK